MSKKPNPAAKIEAERVFLAYWSKGDDNEPWGEGERYAIGRLANGTAPLTLEAVAHMQSEITRRELRAAEREKIVPKPQVDMTKPVEQAIGRLWRFAQGQTVYGPHVVETAELDVQLMLIRFAPPEMTPA